MLFHGGSSPGWGAMVLRIPSERVFVAILCNRGWEDEPLEAAEALARAALE